MTANDIRKIIINKRLALTNEEIRDKSLKMTMDILNDPHYKENDFLYIYFPIKNEIDTNYLLTQAIRDGKTVALPIVMSSGDMVFCKIDEKESQPFHKNRFNIIEPEFSPHKVIDKPGLMIVPIAAYEGTRRVGSGKQYYNNYLFTRKNYLYTIGVAYDFQKVTDLDNDERDIPLNEIRAY